MLSERNKNNSPIKQNLSPEGHLSSPRKQSFTLKQLIQLLKQHNIPIPQQLIQKTINYNPDKQAHIQHKQTKNCQFKLKQIPFDRNQVCQSNTSQKQKRLKIELNDIKFQLKKVQQDYAQYKVLSRMQKQKLSKKYISEIQQLKRKIEQDNHNWQNKYTLKCQQFIQQKLSYQKRLSQQFNKKLVEQSKSIQSKFVFKINNLQKQISTLKSQIKKQQDVYKVQKQAILKQNKLKTQTELNILKISSTQKHKQITKKFQQKIQIIQLEKKIDQQKLQDQNQKYITQINSLKQQIYYLKKQKEQQSLNNKANQRKILQLQMAIRAKQQVYQSTLQTFQQQKQNIYQSNQSKIKQIQLQHQKQIKLITSQHLNQLDSFYQRISNLQQRKIKAQQILKDQMIILQQKFGQRLSKTEDLQTIQRLNTQLVLKQRQISRFQDQLRSSQLLRINNEKNYTRIFSAHSSRRKSSSSKDKQAFFKQSNTTDLKLILKICNKDF